MGANKKVSGGLSFRQITPAAAQRFAPFQRKHDFADTTFAMLYAWSERFAYAYHRFGSSLAVTGLGVTGERGYFILRPSDETPLEPILQALYESCRSASRPLMIEYIPERELPEYQSAASRLGLTFHPFYENEYSDYIYETAEFISLAGCHNKSKRGDYNSLVRNVPGLRYERGNKDDIPICMGIFDEWCASHDCASCYYGCERRALERFMAIFDPAIHRLGLCFQEDKPLSFAIAEQINPDMVCYYFQKNAVRLRGLTFWLNQQMAMEHQNVKYINLGEDMGLPGLITDKASFHPCRMDRKYTAILTGEAEL